MKYAVAEEEMEVWMRLIETLLQGRAKTDYGAGPEVEFRKNATHYRAQP